MRTQYRGGKSSAWWPSRGFHWCEFFCKCKCYSAIIVVLFAFFSGFLPSCGYINIPNFMHQQALSPLVAEENCSAIDTTESTPPPPPTTDNAEAPVEEAQVSRLSFLALHRLLYVDSGLPRKYCGRVSSPPGVFTTPAWPIAVVFRWFLVWSCGIVLLCWSKTDLPRIYLLVT